MTRRTLPILLAVAVSLAWTASAIGGARETNGKILDDYVKSGGKISACKFTIDQLKTAKSSIPEDLKQYGASLIAALDDAIAARAQGGCDKKKQAQTPGATQAAPAAGTQPPPPPGSPGTANGAAARSPATGATGAPAQTQAKAPPTPASEPSPVPVLTGDDSIAFASRSTDVATDPPFPMLVLAILAALLALGALAAGAVRWFAWEPAWAVRMRHAAGEAGWRASSTFSEFADFVRLGR